MKRKPKGKLTLSKETLRMLSEREMNGAYGGVTGKCTTGGSNSVDTCDLTCAGCNSGICTMDAICQTG